VFMLMLAPLVGVKFNLIQFFQILIAMYIIAFAMSGLGIAIAARMKEMEGFQMIVNFIIMPLFFLSGALFPLKNLPPWLSILTNFDPLTYGVDLLRGLMLGLNSFPLTFDLLIMLGFSLVMITIAMLEFNSAE